MIYDGFFDDEKLIGFCKFWYGTSVVGICFGKLSEHVILMFSILIVDSCKACDASRVSI